MNRKDIKGFTIKMFGYYLEFVFVKFLLRNVSLSKPPARTLWRGGQ